MLLVGDRRREILHGNVREMALVALRRLLAVAALVTVIPIMLVTAGLVWARLGRPLIFRQTRCGLGVNPFTVIKFRTMHEKRDARNELLCDAERLTPMTRSMRRFRLDELPQLLAVAKGDMAFIGPRPLLPSTIAAFGKLGQLRCAVLPGLTGWAQVNGNTLLSDKEKLALDLWYVENRSFALDCHILAMTVLVIFKGEQTNNNNLSRARSAMRYRQMASGAEERP